MVDREPSELLPRLGIAPGCKVALAPELESLAPSLRLAGCSVVSGRTPVPSASITLIVALRREEVAPLAAYAYSLSEVSSLWIAVPRRSAERDGLPDKLDRPVLDDLQTVFVPLGLTDNKLLSFGTVLVGYRFVRTPHRPRATGGADDDLDLLEEKQRRIRTPEKPERRTPS